MNNPYLLKKQIQENEEELSNYLRDMNIWQEQMKRKESYTPGKDIGEKKKLKTNHSTRPVPNKISSWDYSAWDKFDVDKACEDVDVPSGPKKNDSDECLNSVTQSKQSEGIYEKNLGNALVQKQKWAEAILRYTRAIEFYDKDPVFYANRALCYLKTNEFKQAIKDCDSSLKLDKSYVKAYQRRSAAYTALHMYNKAHNDLIEILKLEPNNKQTKLDMEVLNKKIKQEPTHKDINTKFLKTSPTNNLQNISSNMLCKDNEESKINVIPKWPSRVGYTTIISKPKPAHLRSKKPFYAPKIQNIQIDQEFDNLDLLQSTLKEVCEQNKKEMNKREEIKKDIFKTEKKDNLIVPPPPLTYVQLKKDWAYLQNDSKKLFYYLKQIPGKRLPIIVRNSMDNDLFVDILNILKSEFLHNGHEVIDYLIGISELPRLQMLVMFCSDSELLCIKELLQHVSKSIPEKLFKKIQNSFGV